jgi:hypothetical protein
VSYTYPAGGQSLSGDTLSISRFLNDPYQVERRFRELAEQRYIADAILTVPMRAEGGAVLYDTGESIFADRDPKSIAPGAEYPLTTLATGTASLAKTSKWGEDAEVTDEAISRQKLPAVDRGFTKLVNQNVKYIDSLAMSTIASAVTNSTGAAADWDTATAIQILRDVGKAKANIIALNQGFDPDTVVLDDVNWMNAITAFINAGWTPRETTDTTLLSGNFPTIMGMRWLATPNVPTANAALVLDSKALGGMADEDLGGPGYTGPGNQAKGVQTKAIRDDLKDQWRLRARRVTVPVVLEPTAARFITSI